MDENRDGLADSLHVEIATPLSSTERIYQVTVIAILNYTLEVWNRSYPYARNNCCWSASLYPAYLLSRRHQGRVKLNMDAVAMHSQTSPLAGESLHVDGNLVLEQREPIHIKKRCEHRRTVVSHGMTDDL